jgi:voltage-gated potassium channel
MRRYLKESEFLFLGSLVVLMLGIGTVFYRLVERWAWLDSLYFSLITLTTVGYGDLAPTLGVSKIFTIFYVLIGIGIILGFVQFVAKKSINRHGEKENK